MSQNLRYSNYLAIKQSGKGIPYGGQGQIRPDGDANYGFKNLKGELENLNQIPELQRDHALYELVRAINQPETGLLSVGCTSGSVHQDDGYRMSGYVEFAFNSDHKIADAANYFPVFFHFDRALLESGFDEEMQFAWELAGATFLVTNVDGFTACVTLNTGYNPSLEDAQRVWGLSLNFLAQYLSSVPPDGGRPLY